MGANTIGKADIFNSGFQGTWVKNENGYFNNQYYINMVNESLPRDEALQRLVKRSTMLTMNYAKKAKQLDTNGLLGSLASI